MGDWKAAMGMVEYETVIRGTGGTITSLSTRERWDYLQRWREVFAADLHAKTGSWKLQRYEWHVFSFGHAQALRGQRAVDSYLAEQSQQYFVIPEDERREAVQICGGKLPDLRPVMDDIYVWPTDVAWTMAFTHEESIGLGPYFSRCEWVKSRDESLDARPS